ncbi:Membrane protein implicated in regulation of membrane protease activity [Pyrobaculum oguniense TE7]|uniref:Membrane protein implicated in regulation of membrane protease activity n=1 Tax=Pyrobaculum oguniense (strain DSM 13380 / JCM 10595 / TE7) TaxID=698757 RepID=H6QD90_PYROT|nr:Membrane protein implicated in regulation of membrane protease activity [Pyrobaculum oguniense TE7]
MSRLVTLVALLDDILLFVSPAVLAWVLYAFGLIPLWSATAISAPFIALAVYVGVKAFKEGPRGFAYVGGRGVAVEDLRPSGVVKIGGEYWRAICRDCAVGAGECVVVEEVKDGVAYVRPCRWATAG